MAEVSEVLQGLDRQDGWGQDLEVASHDLADVAQLRNGGGGGMQHRARWGRFKCQACEPGSVRAMHRRPADRSLTDVRCDATLAGSAIVRVKPWPPSPGTVGESRRTHERTPMPRKERAGGAVATLNPAGSGRIWAVSTSSSSSVANRQSQAHHACSEHE